MCDYSISSAVKTRKAVKGDKLVTANFGSTRGFGDLDPTHEAVVAVCLVPGTEIAFDKPVRAILSYNVSDPDQVLPSVAKFTQVDKDHQGRHHDAIEFADGTRVLLTHLREGQRATVLQLPAEPKNEAETQEQRRVEYAG